MLAGVLGALRMTGRPPEHLKDLKVAVVGAGSAGVGVSQALLTAMVEAGAPDEATAAAKNFMLFDKDGHPTHLYNGAFDASGSPVTFTIVAPIRRPARTS